MEHSTDKNGRKRLFADLTLVLVLFILGLSVFLFVKLSADAGAGVRVYIDGEVTAEYSLSQDGEYSLNGGTNILVISGGEAYVRYAECPDGLCINQGKISRTNERIVCLPNRVVIEVFGAGDEIFLN